MQETSRDDDTMTKKAIALSISEEIRGDILRGLFEPGQALRIRSLADRFGTSDLPVREALWILQKDGLVENRPYAGAFVREYSAEEISEGYEVRSALERLALLKTPTEAVPGLLGELRDVLAALDQAAAAEDAVRYGDLNRQFHQRLVSASANRTVLELLDRLWSGQSAYRKVFSSRRSRITESQHEHEQIFAAFARGDMPATVTLLEEHRNKSMEAALDSIVDGAHERSEGTPR